MEISNTENILDVRDIIKRVEELEEERDNFVIGAPDGSETSDPAGWGRDNPDELEELTTLQALLDDLKGYGGDHQWLGDWYPVTLIHRSYFVEAMKEDCSDLGILPRDIPGWLVIDWDKTANNLEEDYDFVDFDGEEYLYR